MKTPVVQLVHTLSYGDAISTEVLSLRRVFAEAGKESLIFAMNVHPMYRTGSYAEYVHEIKEFREPLSGSLILHYSLGSPLNSLYLSSAQAERTLIFHNLTPPHWFRGVNPRVVRDIEHGLTELPVLCGVSDRLIADSSYNRSEIEALGFHAEVLKLTLDPARWDVARNEAIYQLVTQQGGIQLLHVGRIAPNKCIEDILKVFYYLRHHYSLESRLWLVGIETDTEVYAFGLRRLCGELSLDDHVEFMGQRADAEVRALYEACTAYLCMSAHEGFCLPVAEAMLFGLPVFAFASTALPETVGEGGVLFTEKRYAEIAEAIIEVHENPSLRTKMQESGLRQVGELSFERFRTHVGELFTL